MFHIRLAQWFGLRTKDVVNLDGPTLLGTFVQPWLKGEPIIWEGRRWEASSTRLKVYEGPRLTSAQQGVGAWLKVHELSEDVTDVILGQRDFSRATHPPSENGAPEPVSKITSGGPAAGTTASRRGASGLDRSVRAVILQRMAEASVPPGAIVASFFRDGAFSEPLDYMDAVGEVWGHAIRISIESEIDDYLASRTDGMALAQHTARMEAANAHGPSGLLLAMPEPDFLTAIELGIHIAPDPRRRVGSLATILNQVCERRGVHFRLEGFPAKFVWTSDAATQGEIITPALEALTDLRLTGGPYIDFASARAELRAGTPQARKQAVVEACSAVESTMKVLLSAKDVPLTGNEAAQTLFDLLVEHRIVDRPIEALVLGPSRFGNKRGRHGPGESPHVITEAEAESVVAAAATSITYLARLLPEQ